MPRCKKVRDSTRNKFIDIYRSRKTTVISKALGFQGTTGKAYILKRKNKT